MNKQLQNKLKTYTALTAAAGLAASTADAQIVHTTVNYNGGYETYNIDIDGNGLNDFAVVYDPFVSTYGLGCIPTGGRWNVNALNGAFMYGTGGVGFNLPNDTQIGPYTPYGFYGGLYGGAGAYQFPCYTSYYGTFGGGYFDGPSGEKVFGVRFDRDGDTHYGWIRINLVVESNFNIDWTVVDMAFESQPYVSVFVKNAYDTKYVTTTATDIANTGNASDMQVSLKANTAHTYFSEVSNYKVVLAKADGREWNFYDVLGAMGADFTEDGSGIDSTVNLDPWTYDSDGDAILQNLPYNIYTITWDAQGNPLRMSVDPITLNPVLGVNDKTNNVAISAANKTLNVTSDKAFNNAKLRVFDVTGKVVLESTLNGNNYSANVNEAAGIYIVHILTSEGVITKKVVL